MINPHTRRSRGFGFITFSDPKVADAIIKSGDKHRLDEREVRSEQSGLHVTPTTVATTAQPAAAAAAATP
jgi:RNA recognition motif-containing protein